MYAIFYEKDIKGFATTREKADEMHETIKKTEKSNLILAEIKGIR